MTYIEDLKPAPEVAANVKRSPEDQRRAEAMNRRHLATLAAIAVDNERAAAKADLERIVPFLSSDLARAMVQGLLDSLK